MNTLDIRVAASVDTAPIYGAETQLLNVTKAVIIPNGTEKGNPTVDIQLTDANGNSYVTRLTGRLVSTLGRTVEAHIPEEVYNDGMR